MQSVLLLFLFAEFLGSAAQMSIERLADLQIATGAIWICPRTHERLLIAGSNLTDARKTGAYLLFRAPRKENLFLCKVILMSFSRRNLPIREMYLLQSCQKSLNCTCDLWVFSFILFSFLSICSFPAFISVHSTYMLHDWDIVSTFKNDPKYIACCWWGIYLTTIYMDLFFLYLEKKDAYICIDTAKCELENTRWQSKCQISIISRVNTPMFPSTATHAYILVWRAHKASSLLYVRTRTTYHIC